MNLFIAKLFNDPISFISMVAVFMVSICLHEFCHATIAHLLGDDTARNKGFQTLNPFRVMGWKSILCLLLFGFCWGAVPVLPDDKKRFRRFAISITGPLSNFLLLVVSSLLLKYLYPILQDGSEFHTHTLSLLHSFLYANAILFLFNILPIPSLDGWEALEPFLPRCLIPSSKGKSMVFLICVFTICFSSVSDYFEKSIDSMFQTFIPDPLIAKKLVAEGIERFENGDITGACHAFSKAEALGSDEGRNNGARLQSCLDCDSWSEMEVQGEALLPIILGFRYANGVGVKMDAAEAAKWYRKVAEQGDAIGQFLLGECYEKGNGVKKDTAEATMWYRKAADQGHLGAQTRLCTLYFVGKSSMNKERGTSIETGPPILDRSIGKLGKLIFAGISKISDGLSQTENTWVRWGIVFLVPLVLAFLACLCKLVGATAQETSTESVEFAAQEISTGAVKGDNEHFVISNEAKRFLNEAEQGNVDAQHKLGDCYFYGKGVVEDDNEAVRWYRKAAEQGHAVAQCSLGDCCYYGRGVTKDDSEAVSWYRRAAEQGCAAAQCRLGDCYANGEGVEKDNREATEWYRKSAKQKNADAQYQLGNCYHYGKGVVKDDVEAVSWYRKAAEQWHAAAQCCLGDCYTKGEGVEKDYGEAIKWYRRSAERGYTEAEIRLGIR